MSFAYAALGTKNQVVRQLREWNSDPLGAQLAQLVASAIEQDSKIERPVASSHSSEFSAYGIAATTPQQWENAYVVEASGHRGGGGQPTTLSLTVKAHTVPAGS